MLGLGTGIVKGAGRASNLGIITDNLVLKHNYDAGVVHQVSTGAAYFDGTNDEIDFGSASALDVGTNQFAAMCWFNPHSVTNNYTIMNKGRGLSGAPYDDLGWAVTIYGTNSTIYFDVHAGTDGGSPEDQRLSANGTDGGLGDLVNAGGANKWYHVAVTRTTSGNNSIYAIYLDGVLVDTSTAADGGAYDMMDAAGTINDGTNSLKLGEDKSNNMDFKGYICNFGYWVGGTLSQAQIKSIMWKQYSDLTTTEKSNLVGWWNLDSQVGSDGNAGTGYVLNEVAGAGSATHIGTLA